MREDLPSRLLFSALAENLAEVCSVLSLLGYRELPPPLLSRLHAIEEELREMSTLCRFPPQALITRMRGHTLPSCTSQSIAEALKMPCSWLCRNRPSLEVACEIL